MDDRTSTSGLIGLITVTATFTIGLHQLGGIDGLAIDWSGPISWVSDSATEDVIGATLRIVGLVIGYWVLATTGLYLATGMRQRVRRPRWVTVMTLPGIRRIVDRTLATALAASIAAAPLGPALAAEPQPTSVVVFETADGIPVPHVRPFLPAATDETKAAVVTVERPPQAPLPVTAVLPGPAISAAAQATTAIRSTHTVQRGDNLWLIATSHLSESLERTADATDVVAYWRHLIEANRGTLRSGDPNLIYPGELIVLPALEVAP